MSQYYLPVGLLTTGPDITPGSTLLFRGLGHVTSDHETAAEHIMGYIHAHPYLGITFDRRTPPPDRIKLLQYVNAEHGRNRKTDTRTRARPPCSTAT